MKIVSENRFSGKTYFYTIASRQPDPVKNLLPSDVVLKQTVAMAEGKTWKIIPNGRIRVMISGPVEPLVQRDIDR